MQPVSAEVLSPEGRAGVGGAAADRRVRREGGRVVGAVARLGVVGDGARRVVQGYRRPAVGLVLVRAAAALVRVLLEGRRRALLPEPVLVTQGHNSTAVEPVVGLLVVRVVVWVGSDGLRVVRGGSVLHGLAGVLVRDGGAEGVLMHGLALAEVEEAAHAVGGVEPGPEAGAPGVAGLLLDQRARRDAEAEDAVAVEAVVSGRVGGRAAEVAHLDGAGDGPRIEGRSAGAGGVRPRLAAPGKDRRPRRVGAVAQRRVAGAIRVGAAHGNRPQLVEVRVQNRVHFCDKKKKTACKPREHSGSS